MYEMHIRKEFHKRKLHYLQSSYMTISCEDFRFCYSKLNMSKWKVSGYISNGRGEGTCNFWLPQIFIALSFLEKKGGRKWNTVTGLVLSWLAGCIVDS